MKGLVQFSLKNPAAVLILIVLVTLGGFYSATRLNQEQLPDIEVPIIGVTLMLPGAGPEQMLTQITEPVERAIRGVEGVKSVTSQTANSLAGFQVEFEYGDDMGAKRKAVADAVSSVRLPAGTEPPKVEEYSTTNQPMIYSSVFSEGSSSFQALNDKVKRELLPALRGVDGVAEVRATGLEEFATTIRLDPDKLAEHRINYAQVHQALMAHNVTLPLGEASLDGSRAPVRIGGELNTMAELSAIVLNPAAGTTLGDVALITREDRNPVVNRTNGYRSISLNIVKSQDANAVEVSDRVAEVYDDFSASGDYQVLVAYDRAWDVKESVSTMVREGLLGALFASILILLFLRNVRATVIAVVSIPLSILLSLIALKSFTDVTLNIMTLGGMAVATGRVVDDSIVVIENIVRRLKREAVSKELMLSATMEVGRAILSSTLTTVAVFAPLAFLRGQAGEFFRPFALTVTFSLLASLLVALTVVPLMASLMMRKNAPKEQEDGLLARTYRKTLGWSLNHKIAVLVSAVVLFAGSLPMAGMAGVTFLPETDYKYAFATLEMPKGTEIDTLKRESERIDTQIRQTPEVKVTDYSAGSPERPETVEWFIGLTSEADVDETMQQIRETVQIPEGGTFRMLEDMGGGTFAVTLTGGEGTELRQTSQQVIQAVAAVKGMDQVKSNLQEGTPGIDIRVRQEDALQYGLSVVQASELIRPYMSEQRIGSWEPEGNPTGLYLALDGETLNSAEAVSNLHLPTPTGEWIELGDIADVEAVTLPGSLQRLDGEEYVTVTASITEEDTGAVNAQVEKALKALVLPSGVEYSLGGSSEDIDQMLTDMLMSMAVALGMVYMVMVVAFGEARAPFAILFSLPFAVTGGLAGTLIMNEPISISSLIGFLMLIGIVVTNAIVLVERVQQQTAQGLTIREALLEAGGTRLRPILMTAIATMCALSPLAAGLGGGSIISKGLAVVVIGGLAASTLLTLIIVPVMYELLYLRRARKERRATAAQLQAQPVS